MPDGARTGGRGRLLAREDAPPSDEDFLFHLSRGGDLLVQNRVVEAKGELEKALEVRPQDAQGQDLLAGVYFRLGVYPSAIRLWRQLVEQFPEDAVLHVNLGLALFKTGQPDDARRHLERALALDSGHERAWGYLGLTLWRLGDLERAREAFLRGGQVTMAHRMAEQVLASAADVDTADAASAHAAAADAMASSPARIAASGVSLDLERERLERHSGQWLLPDGTDEGAAAPSSSTPNTRVADVTARPALELGPSGELRVEAKAWVHARLEGLRAVRGPLRTERVLRGGVQVLAGEPDPIMRWQGPVAALVAAPEGMRYHLLRVGGSSLYVKEELVQAFDEGVSFECGKLPGPVSPLSLLSFHGEGDVVLRLSRVPSGLEVGTDQEVRVDPEALVGWTGHLFPSVISEPDPAFISLAFQGQGVVLVT